ncbi:hypothetical protein JTB14_001161 [Gonioctena quinquepunctata]|nr:hypothetical protein JTB14_001161 [Gonioctena quinquepunctata]
MQSPSYGVPPEVGRLRNWMVHEDEHFIFHRFISFEVSAPGKRYHDDLDADRIAGLLADGGTEMCQTTDKLAGALNETMRRATRFNGPKETMPAGQEEAGNNKPERGDGHDPHDEYSTLKRNLNRLIRSAKKIDWVDLCNKLEEDIWEDAKTIVAKQLRVLSPYNPCEQRRKLQGGCSQREIEVYERVDPGQIYEFKEDELLAAASGIKAGKASGPDSIPPEIIKEQSFLKSLKGAKLVFILKPGKPEGEVGSYRPICLLEGTRKQVQVRAEVVASWQEEWNADTRKAKWTRRLIPDVVACLDVNTSGQTITSRSFCLDPVSLVIHASDNVEGLYCKGYTEDVELTVFRCERFER